ncbi:MAG: 5'/3'-nucleotidase SurE [Pseudomonadota bacterium]
MTNRRPLILLTNDDGIHAEGLSYLSEVAAEFGEVSIVAPESEQSAVGHAITLYDPIKVHEINRDGRFYGYGIGGTPADAVKLAVHALLPRPPDLVLSGINNGSNMGINVLYSGTVSAATEAAILGAPAMSFSIAQKKDPPFRWAAPHIRFLVQWILNRGLPAGLALNVNIPTLPPEMVRGYRLTHQCLSRFRESFEQREDPRGNKYFWMAGERPPENNGSDSDFAALTDGFVSITPLYYDLTAHNHAQELAESLETM